MRIMNVRRMLSGRSDAALFVLLASAVILLPWLGETLFYSKGEPREAIVGFSMLESGEWVLPVNYGGDIPYKPPFLGWCIAVLAAVLNGGVVNEYIARLPSALAALAMLMGGFYWARRARGDRFAVIFSLVTLCSFEVFRAALACRLDMVLTACMVGSMYMMYYIRECRPRRKVLWYAGVVVLLSCATLTKGPVGAFLPCFVVGVYRLLRRDRFFPTLGLQLGLVALALVLPAWWFYAAYQKGGEHFYDLMWEENLGRLFGTMSYDSHVRPLWYNFTSLAAGLLPWTVLLLARLVTKPRRYVRPVFTPAGLFALVAAVLIVGFYCIPESKRAVYLLPAYPFLCYGITALIESDGARNARIFFAWFTAVLAIVAPLAVVSLQLWVLPNLAVEPIVWWRYPILVLPMLAGLAWMCRRCDPTGHTLASVWALFLAYAAVGMPMVLNPLSDKKALPVLEALGDAGIYTTADYQRLYSLNFYMGDRLRVVGSIEEAAALPAGSALLIAPSVTDTTGLGEYFDYRPLLERSADHRHPVGLAVRK